MADDHHQRQYRSNEFARASGKTPANDPLAELARLIGQNDPFAEFGSKQQQTRAAAPQQQEWAPQPYAVQAHRTGDEHAYEQPAGQAGLYDDGAQGYESDQYYQDDGYGDGQGEYQAEYDDVPPRRRFGVIAIAAVVAVAVVGTAAAFGYRALFGTSGSSPPPVIKADTTPAKVVPPSKSETQSSKLIYDRVGERSASEKLVPREEQPLDINKPTQAGLFPNSPAGSNQLAAATPTNMSIPSVDQPKKIRTIVIRPDQPQTVSEPAPVEPRTTAAPTPTPTPTPAPPPPAPRASAPQRLASAPPAANTADDTPPVTHQASRQTSRQAAPARNAPLSLSPNARASAPASAEPVRTASAPATRSPPPAAASTNGHYAVQISSQRSEAEAQAAFRALQAKFPAQLSGKQPIIRRADLGSKGIYYRAMVGPFASSAEASELCQNLKSAGGSCLIQKI